MSFKKIEKQNISEQVFQILKQDILDGTFMPGDKLPSENKLSEELGVSKSSIRVAIQRLSTLGLIETRAGTGSYIKEFNANNYLDQMYEFLLSDNDIKQITEYRLAIEMACTEVAIQKATAQGYQRLKEIMFKMDQTLKNDDIAKHAKLDYQFHLEICRMTQNNIFVLAYEVIGKMLRQHTTKLNELYLKRTISQKMEDDVHWRLIEAMQEKDLAKCRECYVEMFSVYG